MQYLSSNSNDLTQSSQPILYQQGREVQSFATLRNLRISLAKFIRSASCERLNQILADSIILFSLYKKHHWLMRGSTFYQLHLLLDKHANEQQKLIDLLSEKIQILGGVAIADPRHVAEVTQIKCPPNGIEDVPLMLSRLLEAHELILREIRNGIAQAANNQDSGTSDLLTRDLLRTHELQAWFLAEHLIETPLAHS